MLPSEYGTVLQIFLVGFFELFRVHATLNASFFIVDAFLATIARVFLVKSHFLLAFLFLVLDLIELSHAVNCVLLPYIFFPFHFLVLSRVLSEEAETATGIRAVVQYH